MKIKFSILTVFYLICSISCSVNSLSYEQRPNIVLLLADDLGYGELGLYGQKIIKTPNLDTLAKAGMIFKNFYAGNAACAPSRAVLLTGKKSSKSSIRGNAGFYGDERWEGASLNKDDFTMGKMFKNAGYQTAFIGKWHLDKPDDVETWAVGHGFDFAVQEQWSSRFGGRQILPNRLWMDGDKEFVPYDYKKFDCKDHLRTNIAFDFLDEKNDNKPFFLFMSYRAPHSFEGPIRDTLEYRTRDWPDIEKAHAAKITLLDKQVGRLINKLKELGALENTLILFTSDNGPHFDKGGHDIEFFNSNGNLKGGKRDLYEGGIRVPMIAYWKNKIRPNSLSYHLSGFQDIISTFSEVIGYEITEELDGISFLPTLISKEQQKHEYLNWEFQLSGWFQNLPHGGFRQSVRIGNWKAVRYNLGSDIQLYDIKEDEGETNNLAQYHPEIINKAQDIFKNSRTDANGFPYGGVVQDYKSMDRYVP